MKPISRLIIGGNQWERATRSRGRAPHGKWRRIDVGPPPPHTIDSDRRLDF